MQLHQNPGRTQERVFILGGDEGVLLSRCQLLSVHVSGGNKCPDGFRNVTTTDEDVEIDALAQCGVAIETLGECRPLERDNGNAVPAEQLDNVGEISNQEQAARHVSPKPVVELVRNLGRKFEPKAPLPMPVQKGKKTMGSSLLYQQAPVEGIIQESERVPDVVLAHFPARAREQQFELWRVMQFGDSSGARPR